MGEAKRKALEKHLLGIHAEGQGVWDLMIYSPKGVLELLVKTANGDRRSRSFMIALEGMVKQVATARRPMLCLTCDNELSRQAMPVAWVLVTAHRDSPRGAVGNGICADCWRRHPSVEDLRPVVTEVWREKMIGDLRMLPPQVGETGRA